MCIRDSLLSKYRPQQPSIACVMKEQVQRQLSLSWGITSLMMRCV